MVLFLSLTSSSTFSADASSAGVSPTRKAPHCSPRCSRTQPLKHPAPERPTHFNIADRGGSDAGQGHGNLLLADLGVTKFPQPAAHPPMTILSRKATSKTMNTSHSFPQRFGCIQDAKTFCRGFFNWYNQDHHHAGIGLMTARPRCTTVKPTKSHGRPAQITLDGAFSRKPRTLRQKGARTARKADRDLDQSTEPPAKPF